MKERKRQDDYIEVTSEDQLVELRSTYERNQRVIGKCSVCGQEKKTTLKRFTFPLVCKSCAIRNTNIERYGNGCAANAGEAKAKREKTLRERYGVDNPMKSRELREKLAAKRKEQCKSKGSPDGTLDAYIADSPIKPEDVKAIISEHLKVQDTLTEPSLPPEQVHEKLHEAMDKVADTTVQPADAKESIKSAILQKYGKEHGMQDADVSDTAHAVMLEKYDGHASVKVYEYKNCFFDSSWELAFYIRNDDQGKSIIRCPEAFEYEYDGETYKYYPDFSVDGKLYDTRGDHFFRTLEDGTVTMVSPYDHSQDGLYAAMYQCALSHGVTFVPTAEIQDCLKYVTDTYSDQFIGLFRVGIPFPYVNEDFLNKGDYSVIQHFHKSLYWARRSELPSPLEAWDDKELVRKTALNRLKWMGHCYPSDILQGFNVTRKAPRVSVFKPTKAEAIIANFCPEAKTIVDPFSGFSGRLIGAMNNKMSYIGFDINEDHVRESNEIIEYKGWGSRASVTVEDLIHAPVHEAYDDDTVLFTCPPYGGKESWNRFNDEVELSCDGWIDLCLEKYKCRKYIIVVDVVDKYKDYVVDSIKNKSHFGTNFEKIVVIER